jgi:hypothetical protein
MKLNLIPWAVAPALVAPLLVTDTTPQTSGLMRVQSQSAAPAADLAAWKDKLSARDLDQRERAFDEFVQVLRQDDDLRRAVRDWRDGSDQELAWTTRLALREARDGQGTGSLRRSPFGGNWTGPNALRSQLDDMQRRFGDLDRMFDEFEQRLNQGRGGVVPHAFTAPGFTADRRSYSMQVTPDGVKVEVEEDVDGKLEKKTYTAKTLDELYEAHPDLKDKLGARVEIQGGPLRGFGGADWGDPFSGLANPRSIAPLPQTSEIRTDRLGVQVEDMSADDQKRAQVDAGVGLKVRAIEPNSIAEKLGLEPGDVIVEVNSRAVKSPTDVREILAQRKSDADVVVTLVDADGKKRTLTWRAPRANEPRAKELREF